MDWLNLSQACRYLGCSRQTIYRELNAGRLIPDGKVGKRHRFSQETLDNYVRTSRIYTDSLRHSKGEKNASQEKQFEEDQDSRNLPGRPKQVSSENQMDRRQNREKEEARNTSVIVRGGSESKGKPSRGGNSQAFKDTIQRLRRKLAR